MVAVSPYQTRSLERHRRLFVTGTILISLSLLSLVPLIVVGANKQLVGSAVYFGPIVVGFLCYAVAYFRFAKRLAAARVTDLSYIEGTTTFRALTAAIVVWTMLTVVNVGFSVTFALLHLHNPFQDISTLVNPIVAAYQSILGLAAILALVGPAFTEYRRALLSGDARGWLIRR